MAAPLRFTAFSRIITLFILISVFSSLVFLGGCSSVEKEAGKKIIGVLLASDMRLPKLNGLKEGLTRYGYVEGKNVSYIIHNAGQQPDLVPALAQELANKHPDVIVVTGEPEDLAAQKATVDSQIPIVFVGVGFAQDIGLVKSYASPGNNITGVDNYYLELSGKRLEYFQRLLPDIKKVAVLYDPRGTPPKPTLDHLQTISKQLNLELQAIPVGNREDVVAAVRALDRQEVDGIMLLCSLLLESITDAISPVALEKGFPVMGVSENQTLKGLLASYGICRMTSRGCRLPAL